MDGRKARKRKSYYLNELGRLGIDPIKCGFAVPDSELENVLSIFAPEDNQISQPSSSSSSTATDHQPAKPNDPITSNGLQSLNKSGQNSSSEVTEHCSANGANDNQSPSLPNNVTDCLIDGDKKAANGETIELKYDRAKRPVNYRSTRYESDIILDTRTRPNPFKLISCQKYADDMVSTAVHTIGNCLITLSVFPL